MNALSANDALSVWEKAQGRAPFERALLMAHLACPDSTLEELAAYPIVERDAVLLELRERTFGPRLDAFALCPACNAELEFSLEIPDLRRAMSVPATADTIVSGRFEFRLRCPSTSDLVCGSADDLSALRLALAASCVEEAIRDGVPIEVRAIPEAMLRDIADRLDELEDAAEVVVEMCCPACAHQWEVAFDIASYLYGELTAEALRLLEDVHVLASAYGWAEQEVLSMPPARRRFYLERVQ